jgi:hypothetical protein
MDIDGKLANWTALYGRLKDARIRLKDAIELDVVAPIELQAEVNLLQTACGKALDELQAEYARMKSGHSEL